jgi:hypothetical protein
MATFSEIVRRATTFFLAAFLWLHALLFLNVQSSFLSKCTRVLRLTTAEVVLFVLLFIFSFLAASGFWKTLLSLGYIYFFPFVLFVYFLRLSFLMLRAMNRWFKAQGTAPQLRESLVVKQNPPATPPVLPSSSRDRVDARKTAAEILQFLLRPFRRFTLLWCILLVVTTHLAVVWLCLVVVLAQLARQIFIMLQILVFSPWIGDVLKKAGSALLTPINNALAALTAVTREADPTAELRNLFNQLSLWRQILEFLGDPYLLSRWAWVLGTVFSLSVYTYIAALFSFAYYGIARVSAVSYSWPDAFVSSLFIPFFFSDLPKVLAVKVLSGIQCLLVLGVGIGTIVNFLRRRLDAVQRAATELRSRFADQSVREKYIILEEKFSATAVAAPTITDSQK